MPDETTALRALIVEAQNLVAHAHAQGMSVTIQPTTNGKPLVRFSRSPHASATHPSQLGSAGSGRDDPALDSDHRLPVYTVRF